MRPAAHRVATRSRRSRPDPTHDRRDRAGSAGRGAGAGPRGFAPGARGTDRRGAAGALARLAPWAARNPGPSFAGPGRTPGRALEPRGEPADPLVDPSPGGTGDSPGSGRGAGDGAGRGSPGVAAERVAPKLPPMSTGRPLGGWLPDRPQLTLPRRSPTPSGSRPPLADPAREPSWLTRAPPAGLLAPCDPGLGAGRGARPTGALPLPAAFAPGPGPLRPGHPSEGGPGRPRADRRPGAPRSR